MTAYATSLVIVSYPSSTSTSPLSILSGYTATFALGLCAASPVFGSHCQPCHGQTSLLPSIIPCPRGPPRCRHTLSMALIVPLTLATQMTLSPQGNSFASPSAGSSDWVVSLVKLGMVVDEHSAVSAQPLKASFEHSKKGLAADHRWLIADSDPSLRSGLLSTVILAAGSARSLPDA